VEVIFNDAMPLRRAHGRRGVRGRRLPDRIGVRDRDAARAADRYHRLGFIIPFTSRDHDADPDGRRRSLARWVYNNEPAKFAAIELVPQTSSDVPETLLGTLNSTAR
jgi:cytochrome d ubiquinol oxidase subunit I